MDQQLPGTDGNVVFGQELIEQFISARENDVTG